MKASNASSAAALVSAIQISCNERLALGCWLFGNLARTFAVLCTQQRCSRAFGQTSPAVCLSEIKSGHIRDAIRRGPGGKEYAPPSLWCAIGEHPCPKPSACASHYSSGCKISESGVGGPRPKQECGRHIHAGSSRSTVRQKHTARARLV